MRDRLRAERHEERTASEDSGITRYLHERQRSEVTSMTSRLVIGAGVREGERDGSYIMRRWRGVTVQDDGGGGEVR